MSDQDEVIRLGDLMQSEGARLAAYVQESAAAGFAGPPYETRMAAYSFEKAVEHWTELRKRYP